ncbi:transposase [Tannerella sp.]
MNNALILLHDRIILCKRALIESINNDLKNICQNTPDRCRSFDT